ncbi:hypothetical protein [Paenibacillus sp. MBLB4367]|uniref:hypothetical protein n=1 Tax=Paenibacillus sp. MBLB4367 TaxID=3384767 RepID=UPI003907FB26
MNCSNCESAIQASWNFCSNCGLKVNAIILHDLTQVNDRALFLQEFESAIQKEKSVIVLQALWLGDYYRISDVTYTDNHSTTRDNGSKTTTYFNSFEEYKSRYVLEFFPVGEISYPQTFKLFLGRRMFRIDRLSLNRDQRLKAFFEKWDCLESKDIQDWYLMNNTEYRNEYLEVTKQSFEDTCEIILTNLDSSQTKELILDHIQSWEGSVLEQLSPKTEPYTRGRGYKEANWLEDDYDIGYADYMRSVEDEKLDEDLKNGESEKRSYDDAMNHRLRGHFGG